MSDKKVLKEFQQFGERFYIIAILMVLSIFFDFLRFFAVIVLFFALGNIKKINFKLQDKNLEKFRSKILNSIVVTILGLAIIGVAAGIGAYQYILGVEPIYYLIPINIAIYGIILFFKAVAVQKKAWHRLNKFFKKNVSMFPEEVINEALEGTTKLEKSCKYTLYVITIPVAIIYGLIGLFKLAKLRHIPIYNEKTNQTPPKYVVTPPINPNSESSRLKTNFCSSCGNKIERPGRFCALCGFDLGLSEAHS